jgi:choline dehydrogenase-like flavoprotein
LIVDGRSLPAGTVVEADICIAGAGAAGITLARELAGARFRVLLLEAGGFEFDAATQDLYRGETTGQPYFPLNGCRLRFFGGSTNHWAGWCRPLDPEDFEAHPAVPDTGWPISRATLDPFYARAHPLCELGAYNYETESFRRMLDGEPLPLAGTSVETRIFQFSPRTAFGRTYRAAVTEAPNVRVVLHSTATELLPAADGGSVRALQVKTLAGNDFIIRARIYVVALGGLANPQLMLASRSVLPAGVGNQHDHVGRFFMEHPHHNRAAEFVPAARFRTVPFYERSAEDVTTAMGVLFLDAGTRRREGLLSLNFSFHRHPHKDAQGYASLKHVVRSLLERDVPDDLGRHVGRVLLGLDEVAGGLKRRVQRRPWYDYRISWRSEQAPNPASRVTLSGERDPLGMPRVRLDWRLSEQDLRTIRRTQEIVAREFGRARVGRVRLPKDDAGHSWSETLVGGSHHMGTTRMSRDPKRGVVDEHCRVHGMGNLYIAGSSVFPTCGSANPTLTIVALALRLADHIREQFA